MHTLTGGQEAGIGAKAGRRGLLGLTRRPSPDAPPLLLLSRPPAAPRPLARLATSVAGPGLGVPAVARAVPRIAAAVPARRVAAGLERRRDRPPPVHRSIGANSLDCLATGDPRERLPLAGARARPPPRRRPSPEYIWADGLEGAPEKGTVFNEMRSKVRVCVSLLFLHCFWAFGSTSAPDHGNRRLNPLPLPPHRPRSCRSRSPTSRPPTFPTGRSTARPPAKPRATTRTASCAPCPSTPTRCAAGTMSSLCAKSSTRTRRRTRPTRARGCANC